jgi:hypothetical protein
LASILFVALDRKRSIEHYSRFRRRIPVHPAIRAAATRSLASISVVRAAGSVRTAAARDCPSGERFTLTRNESLIA